MKTPEAMEKDEIKKYLAGIGAFFFLTFAPGFGKGGMPDIVACIDGIFWGIEVKREGFGPTMRQKLRMAEVEKAGGKTTWGTADKVREEIETWRKQK